MSRFYLPENLSVRQTVNLPDNIIRHLNVLRIRTGTEIILFDGKGNTVEGERFLAGADGKRLYALPVGEETPLPLETHLRHDIRSTLAEQPKRQKSGSWNDNPFRLKDYPEAKALLKRRK